MKNSRRTKVIIPSFCMTSLDTAKCLSHSQFDVVSMGSHGDTFDMPLYYSNIPKKRVLINSEQNMVQALLDIQGEFEEPPVLLLTRDKDALEVSKDRELLEGHYRFLMPDHDVVDKLMDKNKFAKIAQREDFKVPKSREISGLEEMDKVIREFSFPFLLKPYLRHSQKINNEEELEATLKNYSPINLSSLVAQQWIPGPDSALYFVFVYFDRNGEMIAWLTGQKIRQYPPEYGTTSLCRTVDNINILEETIRIFRRCGLVGFGSIEYKHHLEEDAYYIMEPTIGRFNQQIAITMPAGVNFPLIAANYLAKGEIPLCRQKNDVWWIYEPNDYLSQRSHRQEYKGNYWRHLLKADARALWSWTDPLPFLSSLVSGITRIVKRRGHLLLRNKIMFLKTRRYY